MSRKQRRPAPPVAQITGAAPTVTVGAKVYRMGWNDQDAKGRLEQLVLAHVTRAAVAQKRQLGGDDGDEYFAETKALIDAGYYHTLGKGWQAVLHSAEGALLFPLSLFQHHHPEMTADDCRRLLEAEPEQVGVALGSVAPDFFRAALAQVMRGRGLAADKAADAAAAAVADPKTRAAIAALCQAAPTPAPATA